MGYELLRKETKSLRNEKFDPQYSLCILRPGFEPRESEGYLYPLRYEALI